MAVIHVKGDLLASDCNVIAHQANCLSIMGGGIALQISRQLPALRDVDMTCPWTEAERLGNLTYTRIPKGWGFNLYGQMTPGYGLQTNYKALESALSQMLTKIPELFRFDSRFKYVPEDNQIKIGVPYLMGCGLAGGDWNVVMEILERLSKNSGLDIYTYEFQP